MLATLAHPSSRLVSSSSPPPSSRPPRMPPRLVSAGRRKITATKAGRVTVVRTLDLAGRDKAELVLDLPEATAAAPPVQARADAAPAARIALAPRGVSPVAVTGFALAA